MEYDYKKVDWKAVKGAWDEYVFRFSLNILHDGRTLSFGPFLDKNKRARLFMYVDGIYNGGYGDKEHAYYKYHNIKKAPLRKKDREYNQQLTRYKKRVRKELRVDYKPIEPYVYATPVFDNIAQIKRMIAALP